MKLERMMAILTLLQAREWLQAGELAARFEVSVRTIYRDVEALNLAGIPIETRQGVGGGIRVMPGFKLDASLLTERDLKDVVTALKSISTAMPGAPESVLLEKLDRAVPQARKPEFRRRTNEVIIDISPWGDDERQREKLAVLRSAVEEGRVLGFDYLDSQGKRSRREVEPQTLVFKGMNWYLFGWCRKAEDFRMFRLSRLTAPTLGEQSFQPREVLTEERPWHAAWVAPERNLTLVLRFGAQAQARLAEWFESEQIEAQPEGGYLVRLQMADTPWLDAYVLGFGAAAEVIEPPALRDRIARTARELAVLYEP